MTTLKAVEAKSHFSEILDRASKGEEFIVTRRGEPVARVIPFSKHRTADVKELLAELREFRKASTPVRNPGESWNDIAREGLQ
jgi:prevent-host-death family protein